MSRYNKVLAAIDLGEDSGEILERAVAVATDPSVVHVVYVQERMESVYSGVVPFGPVFVGMDEVESKLEAELKGRLQDWAGAHGIGAENTHYLNGSPAREIHRFSEEENADLVVLGTHGRKGVQLLLGSTANSVLHGAACDVLAVRVGLDD